MLCDQIPLVYHYIRLVVEGLVPFGVFPWVLSCVQSTEVVSQPNRIQNHNTLVELTPPQQGSWQTPAGRTSGSTRRWLRWWQRLQR